MLSFICVKGRMSATTFLTIAVICLGALSLGLITSYCILKRKLANTIRQQLEIAIAVQQAQFEEQLSLEAERVRIEEAKKSVLKWIESQLKIMKFSEVLDKTTIADTCGICIDEFSQADDENEDLHIAETP